MKALVLTGYGDNSKLAIADMPRPTPKSGQVLIQVSHAGLNPLDYKIRDGKLRIIRRLRFPHVMGNEVAGKIVQVGRGVSHLKSGDLVYSRLEKGRMGGFAEYVAENEEFVAHAPRTIKPEIAAGIPLVALTAWQCLFDVGWLKSGKKSSSTVALAASVESGYNLRNFTARM